MSEAEQQLRRNIRQIDGAEHLLDEVMDTIKLEVEAEIVAEWRRSPCGPTAIQEALRKLGAPGLFDGLREEARMEVRRLVEAERSLSALREAVSPLCALISLALRTRDPEDELIDLGTIPIAMAERISAAYDSAKAAQRCTLLPDDCGSPARCVAAGACQSAVALTMEVVEEEERAVVAEAQADRAYMAADGANLLAKRIKERLAQKGAGRGR